ncbi:MAG: nucleotidyltransferase family protein [Acutalibacteraceae bacterium]|nr:nucleotidyltransferase family protein [Acutalibacteraceae bacterium]
MIGAVICELNPLHNGHAYLFRQMHKDGCKVIACMSGHFTQRGEPAVFDKYTRTKAALLSGADLVIELPATYACAGAERFAFGGVYLLQALGCVDRLYCGSECGDTARLEQAAQAVADTAVENILRQYLGEGITYAAAREKAVRRLYGEETAAVLTNPNDILGTEYAKALHRLHSPIQLHTIQRVAVAHDSDTPDGQLAMCN